MQSPAPEPALKGDDRVAEPGRRNARHAAAKALVQGSAGVAARPIKTASASSCLEDDAVFYTCSGWYCDVRSRSTPSQGTVSALEGCLRSEKVVEEIAEQVFELRKTLRTIRGAVARNDSTNGRARGEADTKAEGVGSSSDARYIGDGGQRLRTRLDGAKDISLLSESDESLDRACERGVCETGKRRVHAFRRYVSLAAGCKAR